MHIETDLLRARSPGLITETIDMLAVVLGIEGVVTGGDGFVVDDVGVCGVEDLSG